jgi:hypothetical protein
MDGIWMVRDNRYTPLSPARVEIRAGAVETLPAAVAEAPPAYLCPYANTLRNSRVSQALPPGSWNIRWRAEWDPFHPPAFVLHEGRRILVHAVPWRLFDTDGKLIGTGDVSGDGILLDPSRGLLYTVLSTGYLAAVRAADGLQAFLYLPSYGEAISRTLLARRADRILLAGYELSLDPDRAQPPKRSVVEGLDVPEPVKSDSLGLLTSGKPAGRLEISSSKIAAAAGENSVVVGVPDTLYLAGWDLGVRRLLHSSFDPVSISLDEAGRIYLLARVNRKLELWLLTENGERAYAFELPPGIEKILAPPVIAYHHSAYLIAEHQILSVAPDGKLNWTRPAHGVIAGAIVTPDHQLIVAEGDSVTAWDARGQRRILYTFAGEQILTPPVLTQDQALLVATRSRLYCLTQVPAGTPKR